MDVNVSVGVSVLRGVAVIVAVGEDVGNTAAVCVAAAFAVSAINWFTWLGLAVGKGVLASDGTHAMTSARIANQNTNFMFLVDIFSSSTHPKSLVTQTAMVFPL